MAPAAGSPGADSLRAGVGGDGLQPAACRPHEQRHQPVDCRLGNPRVLSVGQKGFMKIDFHNHYYPPEYLAAVTKGPTKACMDYDAEGNPRLHYPGDYNIRVPGHRDLDHREGVLKKHGVGKQVLTFTTPGTHFEEPATALDPVSWTSSERRIRWPEWDQASTDDGHDDSSRMSSRRGRCGWFSTKVGPSGPWPASWT